MIQIIAMWRNYAVYKNWEWVGFSIDNLIEKGKTPKS